MQCEACKADVHPVQEMLPDGVGFVTRCPVLGCGAPMPKVEPRVVVGDEVQVRPALQYDIQTQPMPQSVAALLVPGETVVAQTTAAPYDMVESIRLRLANIELQLANVDKLQAEARRLRAMIAAVEALDAN